MKRSVMVAGACTLVVAGVGATVALGGTSGATSAKPAGSTTAIKAHGRASLHLALLRRRAGAATLSADTTSLASGPGASSFDIASARVGTRISSGVSVLAVTGAGEQAGNACVVALVPLEPGPNVPAATAAHPAAASTCQPGAVFNARGVSESIGNGDLVGLVPDGVRSVLIGLANGTSRTVTVENNAYALHSEVAPVRLSFRGPTGDVNEEVASTG